MTRSQTPPLEAVLRSPWWRSAVVLVLVVAMSFAMSVPRAEIAELRGHSVNRTQLFFGELVRWGAWAIAAWPMGVLARWTLRSSGSWLLFLLVQIPLSVAGGYAFLHLDFALHPGMRPEPELLSSGLDGVRGPDRPGRRGTGGGEQRNGFGRQGDPREPGDPRGNVGRQAGERGGTQGGRGRNARRGRPEVAAPTIDSPFWRFRWLQSILVYWVVLMMGAGVRSFLELRDKERKTAHLELRTERLRSQLASAQMETLKGQLNPHFLFNALHTVGGLVRAREEQTALRTLAAIGELLRATLDHGDAEEVLLSDELRIAESYLDIERIRLGDRLQLELDIEEGIGEARVPALLLLPLVENSVRHGISPLPEGGRVLVRARREGPSLVIEVQDDGVGFPAQVLASGAASEERERRPIGLENTRSRLLALYGKSQQFVLSAAQPHGASVRVVLPYHEQELQRETGA